MTDEKKDNLQTIMTGFDGSMTVIGTTASTYGELPVKYLALHFK